MDQKTIAMVSYFTIIGWIIALIMYSGNVAQQSSLARFHLRQSCGIFAASILLSFGIMIMGFVFPFFMLLNFFVYVGSIVLMIMGAIWAYNGEEKLLPVVGKMAQEKFTFIS